MKFAYLGYGVEQNWQAIPKSERVAMHDGCLAYERTLLKDGHLAGDGVPLEPSGTAKTLRWQQGRVLVTDGPYTETNEVLGGLGLVQARDMEHAVELVSRHPGLGHGATLELRPIDEEALQRQAAAIAALGGKVPAARSQTRRFASFGYIPQGGGSPVSKKELDAMLEQCIAFDEGRIKAGQWLRGIALQNTRMAKTLRARAGKVLVTDGPFAETKEYLGGVVELALEDMNAAVAALSHHPALAFGVVIEIRPIQEEISRRWQDIKGQG